MSPVTDVVAQPATDAAPAKPTARMALDHGQLTRALKIAEFGVCAKSPVEAQRGVLVETGRSRATLTTFDYETAVSVAVPGSAGTGSSLLHFTQLKKALAAMVAGETKAQAERTPDALAQLTPQQRRIVRLAAEGRSNREIAERLFLSPRTVGFHLYRVFPLLGVTSRGQLRDLVDAGTSEPRPVI